MTSWHYATLLEVADAIRTRKTSPVELTRALLRRIDQLESSLPSYARVTPELALAHAGKAEAEIASGLYRGPLHGIPIAVKDLVEFKGHATTAGCVLWRERVSTHSAALVEKLLAAGMIVLGKTHTVEFPAIPGTLTIMLVLPRAVRAWRQPLGSALDHWAATLGAQFAFPARRTASQG